MNGLCLCKFKNRDKTRVFLGEVVFVRKWRRNGEMEKYRNGVVKKPVAMIGGGTEVQWW